MPFGSKAVVPAPRGRGLGRGFIDPPAFLGYDCWCSSKLPGVARLSSAPRVFSLSPPSVTVVRVAAFIRPMLKRWAQPHPTENHDSFRHAFGRWNRRGKTAS